MRSLRLRLVTCALILVASSTFEQAKLSNRTTQFAIGSGSNTASQRPTLSNYARLPLSFEANQEQLDDAVKFISRGSGYQLYLTATEAVLQLRQPEPKNKSDKTQLSGRTAAIVRMKLVGANPASLSNGHEELPGKSNYFIGSDPNRWRTNVPNYAKVSFGQVWPGINLVYYGNQQQLEYDFVVAPGADPRAIKLSFEGAEKVEVDPQGDLVLRVGGGVVVLRKPFVYQDVDGKRKEIESGYVLDGKDRASFQVATYDIERALVIDPVLTYSTYLGGLSDDSAYGIAVDSQRNVYVAGLTSSSDFPRANPLQPNFGGGEDVFVTKLNASGSAILYSTYIGGNGAEQLGDLVVDGTGNTYLAGMTGSTNFPTATPFQATRSGVSDAFVTKLNASGSALLYSTYFGGSGGESGGDIAVNSTGNIFVIGTTDSTNLPRAQPLQADFGGGQADVFITKFNPAGSALIYSTYFGGSGMDRGNGLALDASDNVYITGDTSSSNLPKVNPARPDYGTNGDGFVARLEASGSTLGYSTYLGGSGEDSAQAISADGAGNAYVTGETSSGNFPAVNALQASKGSGSDAFVTKLAAAGTIVYSTFLGGSNSGSNDSDSGSGIAVDSGGSALVTGFTTSPNFPKANPIQTNNNGGGEAFVTKLNAAGSALVYSTFLGGTGYDSGQAIAVDTIGGAYIAGQTRSSNFPTKDPIQPEIVSSGAYDAFIVKITDELICPGFNLTNGPATLSSDSATNELAADLLVLANPMPAANSEVSGAQLKRAGLKVTVRYILESQDSAMLDVKLLDQVGNLRGDGESRTVSKLTSCPPPEGTAVEIVIPGESISLTPIGGVEVTALKLRARLIAPGNVLLKTAEVDYTVKPDAIAFVGVPKINGQDAPDGSRLPADGKVNFTSTLRYHLTNDLTGKIRLRAFDVNGDLLASKEIGNVMATEQPTDWDMPLDFQFDVSPSVTQIRIFASLIAPNGVALRISTSISYINKVRIEVGRQLMDGSPFSPFAPDDSYSQGSFHLGQGYNGPLQKPTTIKLKDELPANLNNSQFEVRFTERLNNGKLIRVQKQDPLRIDAFPRPSFSNLGPFESIVQNDADKWEFQLVVRPPNNAPPIESDIATLPITRIRIISSNPPIDRRLVRGTPQDFDYIVAYNCPSADCTIRADVTYSKPSVHFETIVFDNGSKRKGDSSSGESFKFRLSLPPNLFALVIEFTLSGIGNPISGLRTYLNVDGQAATIPAGGPQTVNGPGVDVNVIQNTSPRTITPGRNGKGPKTDVMKDFLSLPGKPRNPPFPGETHFSTTTSAPSLTTAALFKDFVALNATWQFEPSIPADGSFIANLKFYYIADDFPDDPNFSEAALKIVGFDPATGVLESYPTTLDLNAKTATARVNGLMPRYSIGVFGPFAQRTLNFPILRSVDDFATQLNFASTGAAAAALTLRAFSSAGEAPTGTGITNPLRLGLAAARTLSGLPTQLFGFVGPFDGGWIQTQADKNFIAGYHLLGKGQRLDGLAQPLFYGSTIVLTNVQHDSDWTTEVHLANVTRFPTNLALELRSGVGALLESHDTALLPKETFARSLQNIFQTVTTPFNGYVVVRGDVDLAAAVLLISASEIVALNGQTPIPGNTATKLYAPYVLSDGTSITTRLNLVNPTASAANLTMRFVNATGANVAAPVNLQLASGQRSQREVAQIFSLNPGNLVYGSLVIESSITGVVGDLSYSSPSSQFKFRAALPLESESAKFLAFAHLDNRADSFTDVGIFNPGTQAAQVQVRVLRADGAETGKTTVQVAAGAHFSNYLGTIVGASVAQVGGSFTLSSDQPIVAGAAFGTLSRTTLSALQPQSFDPATFTRGQASVSAASYLGPDLASESIVAAFGVNLATTTQLANTVPLPIDLAGTTVRVRDSAGVERLAPLFFVSGGQINYQLPPGTALGAATITIASGDGALSTGTVKVTPVAPGVFSAASSGGGVAAAYIVRVKNDNSMVDELISRYDEAQQRFVAIPIEFTPQTRDIVLVLFGTGWRGRSALPAVGVKIGGVDIPAAYAGTQGGFVGLDQMNVLLPRSLAGSGEVNLVLTVDGHQANTVRLAFAPGTTLCNCTIAPTSQNFSANGGVGSINIPAPIGCAWTAVSNATWLAITAGHSGNGPGTVNYFVSANPTTAQRSGTLTIAGQTFTVLQAAAASTVTVLGRRTSLGPVPGDCAPPELRTSFLTTDARAYQWTLVTGARIGDQVRWEFSPVSGSFVQTAQYTVQFEGSVCFWAQLEIAGAPASSFTGNWQVRVFYNNGLLFTDNFTINSNSTVTVTDQRMTGGPIPDQCVPPQVKSSFASSDVRAYHWTLVAGAKIGDLMRTEFFQPNGTVYFSTETTLAFEPNACFWSSINIAGTPAATLPGNWQVRVFVNGAPLVTGNFTITASVGSNQIEPFGPARESGTNSARPARRLKD